MVEQKTKVRLFFFLCPDLDVEACTHLLLSQNRFQGNFEFERPPFETWPDAEQKMSTLRSLEPSGKKELVKACQAVIEEYDRWAAEAKPYGPYIDYRMGRVSMVITQKPIPGNYYAWNDETHKYFVVSFAYWDRHIAPPSALEFIAQIVQRLAVYSLDIPGLQLHFATRGCLFDFTPLLDDARNFVLGGYLCQDCRAAILAARGEEFLQSLEKTISPSWMGRPDETDSVASTLKRTFGYDLSRTKGLRPRLSEQLLEHFQAEWTKYLVGAFFSLLSAIGVWLAYLLSRYLPQLAHLLEIKP